MRAADTPYTRHTSNVRHLVPVLLLLRLVAVKCKQDKHREVVSVVLPVAEGTQTRRSRYTRLKVRRAENERVKKMNRDGTRETYV